MVEHLKKEKTNFLIDRRTTKSPKPTNSLTLASLKNLNGNEPNWLT
jgi:hypothetical protein